MRRVWIVAIWLAGCASEDTKSLDSSTPRCPDNSSTVSLVVTPDPLVRNDLVDLVVTWVVLQELAEPAVAQLSIGDVEVDVPLLRTGDRVYEAALLNPFGAGAPSGEVSVLASAPKSPRCTVAPTAAVSFDLH
jgi:hypothetical protein